LIIDFRRRAPLAFGRFTIPLRSRTSKKNRQQARCRFHQSLPAARGGHFEQSVHRFNAACYENQNLRGLEAEDMPLQA